MMLHMVSLSKPVKQRNFTGWSQEQLIHTDLLSAAQKQNAPATTNHLIQPPVR